MHRFRKRLDKLTTKKDNGCVIVWDTNRISYKGRTYASREELMNEHPELSELDVYWVEIDWE